MTSGLSDELVADGVYTTTCWECSAYCGALATVKSGKVVNYGPNSASPHSAGAFCIKGIRGAPRDALVAEIQRMLSAKADAGAAKKAARPGRSKG